MKSKVLYFVTQVLFISFVMLSCSKESDPKPVSPFNVVAYSPADKADDVKPDAKIVITYNKKPSAEMIAGKNFILELANSPETQFECSAAYDGSTTISYTPNALLGKGVRYAVVLNYPLAADGTKLQNEFIISFTTALKP